MRMEVDVCVPALCVGVLVPGYAGIALSRREPPILSGFTFAGFVFASSGRRARRIFQSHHGPVNEDHRRVDGGVRNFRAHRKTNVHVKHTLYICIYINHKFIHRHGDMHGKPPCSLRNDSLGRRQPERWVLGSHQSSVPSTINIHRYIYIYII